MKGLILAAGYATRMHPLTIDQPKPLLPVAGRPIIDYIAEKMAEVEHVQQIVVVTNHRFIDHFQTWAQTWPGDLDVDVELSVLDDGTCDEASRRGAIGDIHFACQDAPDDTLIAAGDNLFSFSLGELVTFYLDRGTDVVSVYHQPDIERLRRTGVASLDGDGRVIEFAEKPARPATSWAVPPLYVFAASTIADIGTYLDQGLCPDAPGHFIEWLCQRKPVHAHTVANAPYDIGTLDSYRAVDRLLSTAPSTEPGGSGH